MSQDEVIARVLDLKALRLPPQPKLVALRYWPYVDWSGIDSLKVRVVLDEDTPLDRQLGALLQPIERAIRDGLLAAGVKLFPYIEYVKPSDLIEAGIEV